MKSVVLRELALVIVLVAFGIGTLVGYSANEPPKKSKSVHSHKQVHANKQCTQKKDYCLDHRVPAL